MRTLGVFSVSLGSVVLSETSARSRKVWMIFKYLITNRHRAVTTESLIEMLWGDEEGPVDPLKSLYTLVSRLRKLLGGGTVEYILFRPGGYQWNPEAPVDFDTAVFESLVYKARDAGGESERISLLREATDLYVGDYLSESSSDLWVQPVLNYYKRLYLRAVNELADLYASNSAQDEIIALCNSAIEKEPYDEGIHERLIQALLINGEIIQAKKQYRLIADRMMREFGARPGAGLVALYNEINSGEGSARDIQTIKSELERVDVRRGALFCTWDTFSKIYQIDKRSDERIKFPVFMALITVNMPSDKRDPKSERIVMHLLRQILVRTLRQGDVVAQYSKHQYLLMLSARLPQNAEAAMVRVRSLFAKECADVACNLVVSLSQVGRESEPI